MSSGGADGGGDAAAGEVVAEVDHAGIIGAVEGGVGDLVEAYEVDAAVEGCEESEQGVGVGIAVVEASEDDVLKGQSSLLGAFGIVVVGLAAEVVLPEQGDYVFDAESALGGHELVAFGGDGVMEGNGEAAWAFVEESHQSFGQPYGGNSDALGAPGPAPGGGEGGGSAEDVVEIVEGFALSHEDDVGEPAAFGEGVDLVEDVGGGELCHESLPAGHAEVAGHFAAHLGGDAERGALAVGDEDGFDVVTFDSAIEVFDGAVLRLDAFHGGGDADLVALGQSVASFLGEVGHLLDGAHLLLVEPVGQLLSDKLGQSEVEGGLCEFVQAES